jgi:hypothetical protein
MSSTERSLLTADNVDRKRETRFRVSGQSRMQRLLGALDPPRTQCRLSPDLKRYSWITDTMRGPS